MWDGIWKRHPDAKPENEREVGSLPPGTKFRTDNLNGTWLYGTFLESNTTVGYAVVKLDGLPKVVKIGDQTFEASGATTVRWPYTVIVEPVDGAVEVVKKRKKRKGVHE